MSHVILRSNSGISLITTLLAMAIASAILIVGMNTSNNVIRARQQNKVNLSISGVSRTLRKYSVMKVSLRNSAAYANNIPFKDCVLGGGSCISGTTHPFYLMSPAIDQGLIAGPVGQPGRFDLQGNPCSAAQADSVCPVHATLTFVPRCAGGVNGAACAKASQIEISYMVQVDASANLGGQSTIQETVSFNVAEVFP